MAVEPFDVVDLIRTKRDKGVLTTEQITWLVDAYTRGYVADEQMSAMTMASKPSGAPTRSNRPGSSAMRRIWAPLGGREPSAAMVRSPRLERVEAELLEHPHDIAVEFRRCRRLLDDPGVEIGVRLIEQAFERLNLLGVQIIGMGVRERPQDEVRFPEAPVPGPVLQPSKPCVVDTHRRPADIERQRV